MWLEVGTFPLVGRSRFFPWRRVYVQVASLVTAKIYAGNSAIHIASMSGHLGVVLVLLKHGNVDVNMANNKGETALHIALKLTMKATQPSTVASATFQSLLSSWSGDQRWTSTK